MLNEDSSMEWATKSEIRLARQKANEEKYLKVKIRSASIVEDDPDHIIKMGISCIYNLRKSMGYKELLVWLKSKCNIDSCYARDIKVGQHVILIREYLKHIEII